VQSDYGSLQAVVGELRRADPRITAIAVVDLEGTILAHSDQRLVGRAAEGAERMAIAARAQTDGREIVADRAPSLGFATPIDYEGKRLGGVFLAFSTAPLAVARARAEEEKRVELGRSVTHALLLGGLSLALGVALAVLQGLGLSRPIRALARQAERMAAGDLKVRVRSLGGDEIGMLGERFNFMAKQLLVLMEEARQKAAMEKELEVARAVQATLVPAAAVIELPGLTLAGHYQPAAQCGGDWWGYFELPGNKLLVAIGDVTGHGVGSAMVTAAARGALAALLSLNRGRVELRQLLATLNDAMLATARGEYAMTCFACILDRRTRTLAWANAGHNAPYLCARGGEIGALAQRSDRLGDRAEASFELKHTKVGPGDLLCWYTDGMVEGESPAGRPYGEQRLQRSLRGVAGEPADRALATLVADLHGHLEGADQRDDITVVIGKLGELT
jgi:sigma-B regulation protein RsbU (phosphoserine phosphatase)